MFLIFGNYRENLKNDVHFSQFYVREIPMSHFSKIEPDGVIEKIYNSRHVENLMAAIHRDDPAPATSSAPDSLKSGAFIMPESSENTGLVFESGLSNGLPTMRFRN